MSIKLEGIKNISSEEEFENHVERVIQNKHTQKWVIGRERGKKIFELMEKFNPDFAEKLVLDLGCGFGGISLFLSQKVKWVIGVDTNKESIRISHLRAKMSKEDNFFAILSSATNIPIKNDSLDSILIDGVLEWVPLSKPLENPKSTQLEALIEVRRVLKGKGTLFLAIENRYYLRYWLGTRDHHSRLRFVPILPRKIADWVSKMQKGEPYMNWTYSYFKLKEILKQAEFKVLKVYVGIPDYVFPEKIVDIEDKHEIKRQINTIRERKSRKIIWGIINKLGLMKIFSSNFIPICQK